MVFTNSGWILRSFSKYYVIGVAFLPHGKWGGGQFFYLPYLFVWFRYSILKVEFTIASKQTSFLSDPINWDLTLVLKT